MSYEISYEILFITFIERFHTKFQVNLLWEFYMKYLWRWLVRNFIGNFIGNDRGKFPMNEPSAPSYHCNSYLIVFEEQSKNNLIAFEVDSRYSYWIWVALEVFVLSVKYIRFALWMRYTWDGQELMWIEWYKTGFLVGSSWYMYLSIRYKCDEGLREGTPF